MKAEGPMQSGNNIIQSMTVISLNHVFGWCWGSGAITNEGELFRCELSIPQHGSRYHRDGMIFIILLSFNIVGQVRKRVGILPSAGTMCPVKK
jgi:hypothetical protein